MKLILASSSPYRRQLLAKLGLHFDCISPDVNEQALNGESAKALAARLALEKAQTVARSLQQHLVIGSDQTVSLQGRVMGKPGDKAHARQQLMSMSGKTVRFYTGLCLFNSVSNQYQITVEATDVSFRPLELSTIDKYLELEKPYDCAGSFKSEGLGIALFKKLQGDDPNSLVGLPLIQLVSMLKNEGVDVI